MFIARSVRRVRFARLVFVLAGVLPCVCLAAWAVHLRSAGHRESLRARWQQAVGLPLHEGIVHQFQSLQRRGGHAAARCLDGRIRAVEGVEQRVLAAVDVHAVDGAAVELGIRTIDGLVEGGAE